MYFKILKLKKKIPKLALLIPFNVTLNVSCFPISNFCNFLMFYEHETASSRVALRFYIIYWNKVESLCMDLLLVEIIFSFFQILEKSL